MCVCVFAYSCRYASLYFCCAIEEQDNELITLEVIHRFVELLDKYFGSVSNWFFLLKLFSVLRRFLVITAKLNSRYSHSFIFIFMWLHIYTFECLI